MKRLVTILVVLSIALLFPVATVKGDGEDCWAQTKGPYGGNPVYSIAIDPIDTFVIYAGTLGGGVFKSTDGGINWAQINNGLTNKLVRTLAIDPTNTQIIYIGTGPGYSGSGGIFKSTDGGTIWIKTGFPDTFTVSSLAIDTTNEQVIYASTAGGGVFKSTDGGASWAQINNGLTDLFAYSLAINSLDTQVVYAGAYGGIYKSTDGGTSWTKLNSGTTCAVLSLAVDPQNTQVIYAGNECGYLFKSTNGGASWAQVTHLNTFYSIVIDPTNAQVIYAGTPNGVYKSTDGGASWIQTSFPNTFAAYVLAIDPQNTQVIYAGRGTSVSIGGGVFKSTDGGVNWNRVGVPNVQVNVILVDPLYPDIVYVGTSGDGIFKSYDGGMSWGEINTNLLNTYILSLDIDPTNTGIIYAGTQGGVFKSIDGGITWAQTGLPNNYYAYSLAIDPLNTEIIYAGTQNAGIFKSLNSGISWAQINNGLIIELFPPTTVYSLAIDPNNTQIIYAGTSFGVFKSTNGGSSWSEINNGLTNTFIPSLAIDPNNTQIIYAGTSFGVFKSTNGGSSWSEINNGLTNLHIASLAIDLKNTQIIYASTNGGGVFKSMDGGASWIQINNGLTDLIVNSVALSSVNSQIIYAGTSTSGVFKMTQSAVSPYLHHFEFSTIQNQTAGVPFNIIITAIDQYGNKYTGFNGSVTLSVNKGTITPTTTASFVNGVLSNFSVTIPDANSGVIITATGGGKTGISNSFDVLTPQDADSGGMQYANWYFGQNNLKEVNIVIDIKKDLSLDDGIYFQAYDGYINGNMFYFGVQTLVGKPGEGLIGKGLIFSEFGTTDSSNIRTAPGGWYEVGTYEGPFISTRASYNWTPNKYILSLKYSESDAIGDWYEFWIEDLNSGVKTYAGALRFPFPSDLSKKGITDNGGTWTELYYRKTTGIPLPDWSVSIIEVSAISKDGYAIFPTKVHLKNADNFYHIDQEFHSENNHLDFVIGGSTTKSFSEKDIFLSIGSINVIAKLDGNNWNGALNFDLEREKTYSFSNVPQSLLNFWVGNYKVTYKSGGPLSAELTSVTPEQTLLINGTINFYFNFETASSVLDHFEFSTITNQTANVPFNITITAKDQYGATYTGFNSSVTLSVNKGTITPTTTASFVNGVLSNFSVTIPDANSGVIIAANGEGKTGTSNQFDVLSSTSSFILNIPKRWSLISVPFTTNVSDIKNSNPNIQQVLYWDGNFWQTATSTLEPGIGYLVHNTSSSTITVTLTGIPTVSPFTETSTGKWQLIGNPFTTSCTLSSTSTTITSILYWDGNFWQTATSTLEPGTGYLIKTTTTGTLIFTQNVPKNP